MKKTVQIRTEYGTVELDVTYCDGPDCTSRGILQYLVNWWKVTSQGVQAATFGEMFIDDMDFCSKSCLKKVL